MEPNQFAAGISTIQTKPKRSILKVILKIFGIIVIIALILSAIISFFVMRADPEKVLAQMMAGIATIETIEGDQEVKIDFEVKEAIKNPFPDVGVKLPKEIKKVSMNMAIHQTSDLASSDPGGAKSAARFDANIQIDNEQILHFILESRLLNKHLYFRMERAEVDPVGFAIEQTKWFDADAKNEIFAEALSVSPELSAEQMRKLRAVITDTKFIQIKEDKGIEWFGLVPTHHYTFTFNAEGILSYLNEASKIMGADKSALNMIPSSTKEIQKLVDEIVPAGDIWITAFGQMPYSTRVPMSLNSLTSFLGMVDKSLSGASLQMVVSAGFAKVNKPVSIEVPTKTMSFEEFTKNAMQQPLNDARKKSEDAAIKSHLSTMRASAELWYDMNGNRYARKAYPFGVCPAGSFGNDSIFNDGQIVNTLQAIYRIIGGPVNTVCVASPRAWAASAKLSTGGDPADDLPDAWCVDSKGASKPYTYTMGSRDITISIDPKTSLCR